MNKCAVIIGVNETGSMPVLSAARTGAIAFDKWARAHDFDTELLIDDDNPITVREIKLAVKSFVESRKYDLIIIYFSGHGILKSASEEYWLLSEAPGDVDEAVAVHASRQLARRSGINHIVFISDACRSIPENKLVNEVTGSIIFPNISTMGNRPEVDMFYATNPGDTAYEVKTKEAMGKFRGIYTTCLLKALNGDIEEVFTKDTEGDEAYQVIEAYELKMHLERSVPLAAELANISLTQEPDAEVNSRPPKYLARFKRRKKAEALLDDHSKAVGSSEKATYRSTIRFNQTDKPAVKEILSARLLRDAEQKKSPTIQTGFTVSGLVGVPKLLCDKKVEIRFENDAWQLDIEELSATSQGLLILPDGSSVPLAILNGFCGSMVFENGQLVNINYTPTAISPKFQHYLRASNQVAERRATIAVMSKTGKFSAPNNRYDLIELASYLRSNKSFDPTLGLYAAYAYADADQFEEVKSIYSYMIQETEPVLYDIEMLSKLYDPKDNYRSQTSPAPLCPVLTKGWSYMLVKKETFHPALLELSRFRLPGHWTTFNESGTELYIKNFIRF